MPIAGYEYSELSENLERLEQELLNYEKQINQRQDSPSSVHYVFRYAHNLKSGLAMVHRLNSSNLVHEIESNFDKIRNGKAAPTPELIRVSFIAIDLIKKNLLNDTEDTKSFQELTEILTGISKDKNSNPEEKKISSLDWRWNQEELGKMAADTRNNYSFYILEKAIRAGISRENFLKLPIYEDITNIGHIIKIHPDYNEIISSIPEAGNREIIIQVLFASEKKYTDIKKTLYDPFFSVMDDSGIIDIRSPAKEKLNKIIRFNSGIAATPISNNSFETVSMNTKEELFKALFLKEIPYQLILIEALSSGIVTDMLDGISKIEKESGYIPGRLIKRAVILPAASKLEIESCFRHLCSICLCGDIKPDELDNELKWLFAIDSIQN